MNLLKRLKSLCFVILTAIGMSGPILAAGTIPLALSVQTDQSGAIASGCLLYFYTAGTVATPQNAFPDFALSQQPLPNPVSCDQSGRLPMFWLADGLIHARLTDSTGVVLVDTTMQVLGPSSGGGGGGSTVDPTTIMATGDMKARYGTGPLSGFVRANGLTIGGASCGCSERANADTQALFIYLYSVDPNLAVSGGRTGNALNDFNANKQLTLPDWRGRALAALDDMGNTAAGNLTSTYFGTSATVLGASGGTQSHTLVATETPANIPYTDPGHSHSVSIPHGLSVTTNDTVSFLAGALTNASGPFSAASALTAITNITINPSGGAAHSIVPPLKLATIYVKL